MLTHFFFLLQNVAPPSDLTVNVIVSIASITLATATNYIVSSKAAGRLEGANAERFNAIDKRLDSHAKELDQVWSKVGANTKDIATVQGELKGIRLGKGNRA
jgi:hypothetical protein